MLRHQPQLIGIELDEQGWVYVDDLIKQANAHGRSLNMEQLNYVVETNSKKRFAFNESWQKIRASQGHSVAIDLGYQAQIPPEILYHGTGEKSIAAIQSAGLEKWGRQHVHLSRDIETAIQVGAGTASRLFLLYSPAKCIKTASCFIYLKMRFGLPMPCPPGI